MLQSRNCCRMIEITFFTVKFFLINSLSFLKEDSIETAEIFKSYFPEPLEKIQFNLTKYIWTTKCNYLWRSTSFREEKLCWYSEYQCSLSFQENQINIQYITKLFKSTVGEEWWYSNFVNFFNHSPIQKLT